MSAHTPGPWSITEDRHIVGADGVRVAEPHGNPRDVFADAARVEADRALMCAAPDMLIALQTIALHITSLDAQGVRELCEAAIAKARGA
jgi:hypothetical protein